MIKEILRKGKFNDDDCRKVEPDDIVSIPLKNAHISFKMKMKKSNYATAAVSRAHSPNHNIVCPYREQTVEMSDRHIKCKVHSSQTHKIRFHPHD